MADFRINQLQFPDPVREQIPLTVPKTLNELGDVFAAQKRREAIGQVLQGSPDIETAARRLGELGLIEEARPLFALAQQKAALGQSAAQHAASLAEQARHNQAVEGLAKQQFEAAQTEAAPLPYGGGLYRKKSGEVLFAPSGGGTLDDETVDAMAKQYRAGDTSVLTNLGRGAQGAENIVKLRAAVAKQNAAAGISGEEQAAKNAEFFGLKAGQRTLGTRTANIEMATAEAQKLAPLVLQASEAVDRTRFPLLNSVILAGEKGTGDENVVRLGVAINSFINVYSRAINPTGNPTINDKEHARELLQAAWSKGQIGAAIGQLGMEMTAARQAPGEVRQQMREGIVPGAAKTEAPAGMSRDVANQKIQAVRSIMQQRISGGADPAAELKAANDTLRRNGLPPLAGP
jgi:hypothetical protein